MDEISCKLLVIGAGPGGYTCAIRAGQLGIDTVVVEAQKPGGTCLNIGCIPSKALIHAADAYATIARAAEGKSALGISTDKPKLDFARTIAWKDNIVRRLNGGVAGLLQRAGVRFVAGSARFRDGKTVEVETPTGLKMVHAEALALAEVPKRLVVVGAGYIGLELGTAFAKLGAAVTVVEAEPRILPEYDRDLSEPVARRLRAFGVTVLTGAKAKALVAEGDALAIETADDQQTRVEADKVLVTVGRRPVTSGLGLDLLDLDMEGPFIRIDDRCRTSMRGIFAIGDVTGEPMLAHRAMAQGEMVAEIIAGRRRAWDRISIPVICFTDPEIVSAGLSPSDASRNGFDIKTDIFPFKANGRALTLDRDDGFIRIVARADDHLLLGIQGVGAGIAELSAAFSLALEMGARLEDIAMIIHAHPTESEAFHEAALKSLGHAIHI